MNVLLTNFMGRKEVKLTCHIFLEKFEQGHQPHFLPLRLQQRRVRLGNGRLRFARLLGLRVLCVVLRAAPRQLGRLRQSVPVLVDEPSLERPAVQVPRHVRLRLAAVGLDGRAEPDGLGAAAAESPGVRPVRKHRRLGVVRSLVDVCVHELLPALGALVRPQSGPDLPENPPPRDAVLVQEREELVDAPVLVRHVLGEDAAAVVDEDLRLRTGHPLRLLVREQGVAVHAALEVVGVVLQHLLQLVHVQLRLQAVAGVLAVVQVLQRNGLRDALQGRLVQSVHVDRNLHDLRNVVHNETDSVFNQPCHD